ncbi:MAG: hypothetical protein ACLUOD_10790 [[Clostridium] innocuum]
MRNMAGNRLQSDRKVHQQSRCHQHTESTAVPIYGKSRRELIEMENLFGLTPKGFKAIKAKGLDQGKKSVLGEALERLERKS